MSAFAQELRGILGTSPRRRAGTMRPPGPPTRLAALFPPDGGRAWSSSSTAIPRSRTGGCLPIPERSPPPRLQRVEHRDHPGGEGPRRKVAASYGIGTIHSPAFTTGPITGRHTSTPGNRRGDPSGLPFDRYRLGLASPRDRERSLGDLGRRRRCRLDRGDLHDLAKVSDATHPNWKRNEAFASVLARAMDEVHPGLFNRVTAVHDRRYNQDLHPHMLLLEVGNYLDLEEHAIAAATLPRRCGGDRTQRDPLGPDRADAGAPVGPASSAAEASAFVAAAAASLIPAAGRTTSRT